MVYFCKGIPLYGWNSQKNPQTPPIDKISTFHMKYTSHLYDILFGDVSGARSLHHSPFLFPSDVRLAKSILEHVPSKSKGIEDKCQQEASTM